MKKFNSIEVNIWLVIALCCSFFSLGIQIAQIIMNHYIDSEVNTSKLEKSELDTIQINGIKFIPIK